MSDRGSNVSEAQHLTIGPEEQNLGLSVEVNKTLLDTGTLARDQQVDDTLSRRNASACVGVESLGEALTSTYFSKQSFGFASSLDRSVRSGIEVIESNTYEGKIVPLAPPSGMSLFFSDCVDAKA